MNEAALKSIVVNYLEKKGYKKALNTLEQEIKRDIEVTDLSFSSSNEPDISISNQTTEVSKLLTNGYQNTCEWINSSLDLFKNELIQILYPIFVHSYLEMISKGYIQESKEFFNKYKSQHVHFHGNEIHTLEGVQTQSILTENELTQRFLKSKYDIRISQISYDLLMKYLQDSNDILILSIVNQYLNFKVFKGQPSSELIKNDSNEYDFEDEKENLSLTKLSLDVKTASGPAKRGRKKKVQSITSKSSMPSICFYTFFNSKVNTIEFGVQNDKPLIVGGFEDSSIKYWKSDSYESLYGHTGPVYGLSLSSDQKWLLSSSEDSTVRLWNLETKSNIVAYKGHQYPVWSVDFSNIDYLFASCSHDRTARIWSTDRVTPLRVLAGHLSDVDCVKFHPNSNYVATGSSDRTVRLWDINSGECVRIFSGHFASVHSLSFSNDGKYLASGGADNDIFIWDISHGKYVHHLRGHTDTVTSLSFNHDSTLLSSGSLDQSVKVWDFPDCSTFYTKKTPVYYTNFQKNVLVAAGPFTKE
eukprot:gene4249-7586_t